MKIVLAAFENKKKFTVRAFLPNCRMISSDQKKVHQFSAESRTRSRGKSRSTLRHRSRGRKASLCNSSGLLIEKVAFRELPYPDYRWNRKKPDSRTWGQSPNLLCEKRTLRACEGFFYLPMRVQTGQKKAEAPITTHYLQDRKYLTLLTIQRKGIRVRKLNTPFGTSLNGCKSCGWFVSRRTKTSEKILGRWKYEWPDMDTIWEIFPF